MSRSNSKSRRYTNAREFAQKQRERLGSSYLKLPAGVKLFKAKPGIMLLDILPFEAGKGNPNADPGLLHWERSYWVHHNIGVNNERVICPAKTSKKRCPICELRMKLMKKDEDDNEEEIKSLQTSHRQLFNVINRKDPDAGVQIFDVSYHCFGDAISSAVNAADEDEGVETFFLLEGGFTLKVNFEEESFGGNKFIKADRVDFKPRKTDYDEDMLEGVVSLDDILVINEYDVLLKMLLAVEDEEDEDEDDEDDKPVKKKKAPEDEDEEDEDDEPVKSKSRKSKEDEDEDEEDEDDEPVKSKKKKLPKDEDDWGDFDEEEEPVKSKKKKDEDEDEDEDDAPVKSKKKSKDEDDEEDEDDEDEEEPKGKKRNRFDDDEEDEDEEKAHVKAKSKKSSKDEDDWDED